MSIGQKITLQEWAQSKFRTPPCRETLRRWVGASKIWPTPQKIGRAYYVDPNAEYIDPSDTDSLLEKINGPKKT